MNQTAGIHDAHADYRSKRAIYRHPRPQHEPTAVVFKVIHDTACRCSYFVKVHWHDVPAYYDAHAGEVDIYKVTWVDPESGEEHDSWAAARYDSITYELTSIVALGGHRIFTFEDKPEAGA